MNWLDIVIAVPLCWAVYQGFKQGLVVQLVGLAALFVGVYLAFRYGTMVGEWFRLKSPTSQIVGFALVLVLVIIALALVGRLTRGLFHIAGLGIFDTLLGVVFAVIKVGLILGVLLGWFRAVDSKGEVLKESATSSSVLYGPVMKVSDMAFPYLLGMKDKLLGDESDRTNLQDI